MGGTTINDCLTNNFINDNTKIKVIFVSKQDSNESDNNCYIDEKFKPINMPFEATFSEEERIINIKEDFNTKKIEQYYGIDIKTFTKLVLNKPRSSFNEYDDLFFNAFKINHPLYSSTNTNYPNFTNCKLLNQNFELISSDEKEDTFFIIVDLLFVKYKLIFIYDKIEKVLKINKYKISNKVKEEIFIETMNFFNEKGSNLRSVFERFYKEDLPVFIEEELMEKIQTIEKIFPMIFSTDIKDFMNNFVSSDKIKEEMTSVLSNITEETLNYIDIKKEKKFFFFEFKEVLRKLNQNLFTREIEQNDLFQKIYFSDIDNYVNDTLFDTKEIFKEELDKIINIKDFISNLNYFYSLTKLMKILKLEFKTFSLTGFPDREKEILWRKHCKKQSENFRD